MIDYPEISVFDCGLYTIGRCGYCGKQILESHKIHGDYFCSEYCHTNAIEDVIDYNFIKHQPLKRKYHECHRRN